MSYKVYISDDKNWKHGGKHNQLVWLFHILHIFSHNDNELWSMYDVSNDTNWKQTRIRNQ